MSGNSGGARGSTPTMWPCIHCNEDIPPTRDGKQPNYCMFCGEKQLRCVNPECREPLFSDKAEMCHKCNSQQKVVLPPPSQGKQHGSSSADASQSGTGVASIGSEKSADKQGDKTTPGMNTGNVACGNKVETDPVKRMEPNSNDQPNPSQRGESSVDSVNGNTYAPEPQSVQQFSSLSTPTNSSSNKGSSSRQQDLSEKAAKPEQPGNKTGDSVTPPPANQIQVVPPLVGTEKSKGQARVETRRTSDSDTSDSSDREQFHTPPPDMENGCTSSISKSGEASDQTQGTKTSGEGAGSSASLSEINLRRLSLQESASRKHSRIGDESEDSDGSNPAKRKALDNGAPPLPSVANIAGTSGGDKTKIPEVEGESKDGEGDNKRKSQQETGQDSNKDGDGRKTDIDHPLKDTPEVHIILFTIILLK